MQNYPVVVFLLLPACYAQRLSHPASWLGRPVLMGGSVSLNALGFPTISPLDPVSPAGVSVCHSNMVSPPLLSLEMKPLPAPPLGSCVMGELTLLQALSLSSLQLRVIRRGSSCTNSTEPFVLRPPKGILMEAEGGYRKHPTMCLKGVFISRVFRWRLSRAAV